MEPTTYLLQNRDGIARHVDGIQNLVLQNSLKDFIFVVSTEGRLSQQHFVNQHAKGPPIHCATILLLAQNLGRHELGRSTESVCSRSIVHVLFAETVIRNLDMTIQCQQNVVQFQITISSQKAGESAMLAKDKEIQYTSAIAVPQKTLTDK